MPHYSSKEWLLKATRRLRTLTKLNVLLLAAGLLMAMKAHVTENVALPHGASFPVQALGPNQFAAVTDFPAPARVAAVIPSGVCGANAREGQTREARGSGREESATPAGTVAGDIRIHLFANQLVPSRIGQWLGKSTHLLCTWIT